MTMCLDYAIVVNTCASINDGVAMNSRARLNDGSCHDLNAAVNDDRTSHGRRRMNQAGKTKSSPCPVLKNLFPQ